MSADSVVHLDPWVANRRTLRIALLSLAVGGALFPFALLGLLAFLVVPASGAACFFGFRRIAQPQPSPDTRDKIGVGFLVFGTVVLCIGATLTPLGLFSDTRTIGAFHFLLSVRPIFGTDSLMSFRVLSLPVVWALSFMLLGIGLVLRAGVSAGRTVEALIYAMVVFPVGAAVCRVLALVWPLGV